MVINKKYILPIINSTNISKIIKQDGVTLSQIGQNSLGCYNVNAADGDNLFCYFSCVGNESLLELRTFKNTTSGIFDIYINELLHSSGYDDYNATGIAINREINVANKISRGNNVIKIKINGKNALSSNYNIQVLGASLQ
jgi:hypothetical protein